MCYLVVPTQERGLKHDRTIARDDQDDQDDEEPKLYARTLIPLNPDHPEDGPGIPAGVIVEVTDENGRLMAYYHDVHMDVVLNELDCDV